MFRKTGKISALAVTAALAVTCAFAFAACGNNSSDDVDDTEEPAEEEEFTGTTYSGLAYVEGGTTSQTLDLYIPDSESTSMPLLVFLHGGMFTMGNSTMVKGAYEYFRLHDYVCASLNYSLGEDTYPAGIVDTKTAIQFLYDNASTYSIDTDKIVVMGESAGSYVAAMAALSGPGDFMADGQEDEYTFSVAAYVDFYGPVGQGMTYDGEELSDSACAAWIGSATDVKYPLDCLSTTTVKYIWIQQGDADTNVPYVNATAFYNAVIAVDGFTSEGTDANVYYEILEGASHMDSAFYTDENLGKLLSWLNERL